MADQSEAVYASVGSRLLALAVDGILLTAILYVAAVAVSSVRGPVVEFSAAPGTGVSMVVVDQERALAMAILSVVISAIYFVGSWVARSATPGQGLLGIRVRQVRGGPLLIGQAVARWLLLMGPLGLGALLSITLPQLRPSIDPVTIAWSLLLLVTTLRSSTRQGLHDRAAGSVVIRGTRLAHRRAAA